MQEILFIGSSPQPLEHVDLLKQFSQIQSSVLAARLRDFTLHLEYAVPAENIVKLLSGREPAIVHFAGHASGAGLFMDGIDRPVLLAELDVLGDVLGILGNHAPRCVVLNACNTADPPPVLLDAVDFVVGWDGAVHHEAATTFADNFYGELAAGKTVKQAFELAENAVAIGHKTETAVPKLLGRALPGAGSIALTRQPWIKAEFLIDEAGMPNRKGKFFEVRLSIQNIPAGTYLAVYQLSDGYDEDDEFNKVFTGEKDLELLIDYWEDFEVKVTLWTPEGGVCVKRRILEALKESHPDPTDAIAEPLRMLVTA